jgi:biuret amidohydrolase
MPPDLAELTAPPHTVLVTSECQNGVIGEQAIFPELAAAARPATANIVRLTRAARDAGVQVVHCLALRREDGKGANTNARLFGAAAKSPVPLTPGSEAAALVPDLAGDDRDITLTRLHGLNPMAGTDLDSILRNLGATTVIVAGVSINVALTNLVMDAVNAGYRVVLPRDATAGTPPEYAAAVIDNTLSLLATITTTNELIAGWSSGF